MLIEFISNNIFFIPFLLATLFIIQQHKAHQADDRFNLAMASFILKTIPGDRIYEFLDSDVDNRIPDDIKKHVVLVHKIHSFLDDEN